MTGARETLGLDGGASPSEIRDRFLELVRQHPPDRDPERFAAIHAAYKALEDPASSLQTLLFELEPRDDSWDAVAADVRKRIVRGRLELQSLLDLADPE